MTDDMGAFDRLLAEALERGGPQRAPDSLTGRVLLRTERMAQRPSWVPVLDRRTWPPAMGTIADPAVWRYLRTATVIAVMAALLATAALVGARLLTQEPVLPYRGELTPVATLSHTYTDPRIVALDDRRVLIVGGTDASYVLGEVVDLGTGLAEPIPAFAPALMLDQLIRLDDGRVIALGWQTTDIDGEAIGVLVAIDVVARESSLLARLPDDRSGAALALLPDGRLLIAGGSIAGEPPRTVGSVDIVDPRTGTITPTGALVSPRAGATATALADGRILVVGGSAYVPAVPGGWDVDSGTDHPVLEVEVYDPGRGTFTVVGTLPDRVRGIEPVLLRDGRVLIPGVQDAQVCGRHGIDSINTYLFDPGTDAIRPGPRLPHDVSSLAPLGDGTILMTGWWTAMGPAPGGCTDSPGEYVLDAWIGTLDPVTGVARLSYDPFTERASLPGDPDVPVVDIANLPDGRAVLVTSDTTGTVDPPPLTQIMVFE